MQNRLGRATLSQLAFSGKSELNFLQKKSRWDNKLYQKKKKKERKKDFLLVGALSQVNYTGLHQGWKQSKKERKKERKKEKKKENSNERNNRGQVPVVFTPAVQAGDTAVE